MADNGDETTATRSVLSATEEKLRNAVSDMGKAMEGAKQKILRRGASNAQEDLQAPDGGKPAPEGDKQGLDATETKIQGAVDDMATATNEPSLIGRLVDPVVGKIGSATEYIKDKIGTGKPG